MIVKNEEDTLGRCLDSVLTALDEIVVVDTGSTDNTVRIAEEKGAKVFYFDWHDDFAEARNFSFSKSTADYIMWLDADDVLEASDLKKLMRLKQELNPKETTEVAAKYNVAFDESGNCTLSYYRERIFLRSAGFFWKGAVHETIELLKTALYSDFAVRHAKIHPTEQGRNLRIYQNLLNKGEVFSPRQNYYFARELFYNRFYEDAVLRFSEFLSGNGWKPDKIGASLLLSKCYKILGNREKAKSALFESFLYGIPTSEICCEIGDLLLSEDEYSTAAFWYLRALDINVDDTSGAFCYLNCSGYIPNIQLCVCYDKLGDYVKAWEFNEKAAAFNPQSEAVKQNREYFQKQRGVSKSVAKT